MTMQYGCLIANRVVGKIDKRQYAHFDDVTHDTCNEAVREALWLMHNHSSDTDIVCVMSADLETGTVKTLLNYAELVSIEADIDEDDWDYFSACHNDLPLPGYTVQP